MAKPKLKAPEEVRSWMAAIGAIGGSRSSTRLTPQEKADRAAAAVLNRLWRPVKSTKRKPKAAVSKQTKQAAKERLAKRDVKLEKKIANPPKRTKKSVRISKNT